MNTSELKERLFELENEAREITEKIAETEKEYYSVKEVDDWLVANKFKRSKHRWTKGDISIHDYGDVIQIGFSTSMEEGWISNPKDKLKVIKETMGKLLAKEKKNLSRTKRSVNILKKTLGEK